MRAVRPAVCLAAAGLVALSGVAVAHDGPHEAPPPTATTRVLYMAMSQSECDSGARSARLEPIKEGGAEACGTTAGVPLSELGHRGVPGINNETTTYTSNRRFGRMVLDGRRMIKGQVAAKSAQYAAGVGGVGTVTFDVQVTAKTTAGRAVTVGKATVSTDAHPDMVVVAAPFAIAVPPALAGKAFSSFSVSVLIRGESVGSTARGLKGDTYIALPALVFRR